MLKDILVSTEPIGFITEVGSQEYQWFVDMKRDGSVCGEYGYQCSVEDAIKQNRVIPTGGKSGFFDLHVPEKGKQFIRDYDAVWTIRGIIDTWTFPALRWILVGVAGIAVLLLSAYILNKYGLK